VGNNLTNQQKVDVLALARLKVLDVHGNEVLISSFWKDRSVVLIFLRHFSCIACRTYVEMIWKKKEELKRTKTRVVFIGNGAHQFIKTFKDDLKVPDADIYTDPSLESFQACGMIKGIFNLIDPRGAIKMVEFALKGQKQGPWDKDSGTHTQMGGIVAMKYPGKVVYHYLENYLGDFDTSEGWKKSIHEPLD
jgi:peroxiredoxin